MDKISEKWFNEDIPVSLAKKMLNRLGIDRTDELIAIIKDGYDEYLAQFSIHHYSDPKTKLCSLCGNGGMIDTTHTAISPKGQHVGRKSWCCCPNGVAHRKAELYGELNDPNSY